MSVWISDVARFVARNEVLRTPRVEHCDRVDVHGGDWMSIVYPTSPPAATVATNTCSGVRNREIGDPNQANASRSTLSACPSRGAPAW